MSGSTLIMDQNLPSTSHQFNQITKQDSSNDIAGEKRRSTNEIDLAENGTFPDFVSFSQF